jgi:hypothetical protein
MVDQPARLKTIRWRSPAKPHFAHRNKSLSTGFQRDESGIYSATRGFRAQETPPMNKALEVLLTVLALAGMYCAIPQNNTQGGLEVRAQQEVLIADGSDPMPLCRRHCK